MKAPWPTLYGQIPTLKKRTLPSPLGMNRLSFLSYAIVTLSPLRQPFYRGAGYTFGSGVVRKFLAINNMAHILRAHQLCMEGFSVLFDNHLSTVWSAPNYCYRCGNSASILEVKPGKGDLQEGDTFFNVFEAAPENERDGPGQQAQLNAGGQASNVTSPSRLHGTLMPISRAATGVFLMMHWTTKCNDDLCYDNHVIQVPI
jgi:hypothetical protein